MPEAVVVRLGRPRLTVALVSVVALVDVAVVTFLATIVLSLWRDNRRDLAAIFLAGAPVVIGAFALAVWVLVVALRQSRVWRPIELTTSRLRLPQREWADVPVDEIAGVGLARSYAGRAAPTWRPIFWRTNGTHVLAGDFTLSTGRADPTATSVARRVAGLAAEIARLQGPDGALIRLARQRSVVLSAWGDVVQVWDPATGHILSAPPSAAVADPDQRPD